jgi:hypothetical protein
VTAAVVAAPGPAFADECLSASQGGGRVTLEERLQRAWRLLHADGAAECPICRGEMTLRGDAGECGGCGTKMT